MGWRTEQIVAATGGRLVRGGVENLFGEIVTDSGKVQSGAVFVALKGERFDGHRFVGDAASRGAGCIIVHKRVQAIELQGRAVIRVRDTLKALGDLAHYRREQLAPKVLAIT